MGGNTVVMYHRLADRQRHRLQRHAERCATSRAWARPSPATRIGELNIAQPYPGCSSGPSTAWIVAQLQTTTLNIVGVGTHWLQGDTTMNFGFGVVTDQLTITSPTTATAQITCFPWLPWALPR